ncbi:MAG: DUF5979 domain-containing protein, partial [Acidimicrobiales bacterium]
MNETVILALSALVPASPASGQTTDGLAPVGQAGNLPDSGTCGDNGERWVKFATGGGDNQEGQISSGNPKWTADYASSSDGTFQILAVYDKAGNPVYFDGAVGGAASSNPEWEFELGAVSPVLLVQDANGDPESGNFSQFAICALLEPYVSATITKTVVGEEAPAGTEFVIGVECKLVADGVDNLADPGTVTLLDGESATILAPATSTCTVTETPPDNFTLESVDPENPFTMPAVGAAAPTVTVTNRYTAPDKDLTITKTAVGGSGSFTFDLSCTDPDGNPVAADPATVTIDAGDGAPGTATVTVPADATCTATEQSAAGFVVDEGTKSFADDGTVSFTNTAVGRLAITKDATGAPEGTTFPITYACDDGTTGTVALADD